MTGPGESAEVSRDFIDFLRSVRAVRRYAPTPVPDTVIHDVLEVGRWTGSAKNTQPWEFLVVQDRETLRQLSTLGQYADHLNGAAFAILLIMDSPAHNFDAGRLAEHLMLAAWAHGVGSCIGSIFPDGNEARAKEILGVPAPRAMRTAIAFGYPADANATRIRTSPGRISVLPSIGRKPLSECAFSERYRQSWGDRGL